MQKKAQVILPENAYDNVKFIENQEFEMTISYVSDYMQEVFGKTVDQVKHRLFETFEYGPTFAKIESNSNNENSLTREGDNKEKLNFGDTLTFQKGTIAYANYEAYYAKTGDQVPCFLGIGEYTDENNDKIVFIKRINDVNFPGIIQKVLSHTFDINQLDIKNNHDKNAEFFKNKLKELNKIELSDVIAKKDWSGKSEEAQKLKSGFAQYFADQERMRKQMEEDEEDDD